MSQIPLSAMPGLGVGQCTPYAQTSNYHTVLNHRFREESPYVAAKQTKVKCSYCGVWATKGRNCTLCGTRVPGQHPQSFEGSRSRSPAARGGGAASARRTPPPRTPPPASRGSFDQSLAAIASPRAGGGGARTVDAGAHSPSRLASVTPEMRRYGSAGAVSPGPSSGGVLRHGPDQQARKIKCSYCGIWVQVGKTCSLCRTQA